MLTLAGIGVMVAAAAVSAFVAGGLLTVNVYEREKRERERAFHAAINEANSVIDGLQQDVRAWKEYAQKQDQQGDPDEDDL